MLERYEPYGRAMSLRQLMDRMLEDAFVMPREGDGNWGGPMMDIYEQDDKLVLEAQLPGMKPDDVDVQVEQGVLTISGRSEREEERKERNYLVRERRAGSFSRSVRLPSTYDSENCEASFENGVLRLTFPKSEQAKPRRISVGAGGQRTIEGEKRGEKQERDKK